MTYLLTWKGTYKNIDIGRYADKAAAKHILDNIEDPAVGGCEVDTEIDLDYPKTDLIKLFNALTPSIEGVEPRKSFVSKTEGQRYVFTRIEDVAKNLPITEVIVTAVEPIAEAPASEPTQENDMATKKAKTPSAKKVKAVKAKTVRVAKAKTTNGAGKDEFGLRKGSKASDAAAMFARKNGATMEQVREATGANQYNLLKTLAEAGHKHVKEGKTFFLASK